ncbi:O-antigen ligase-related [Candidatus Nanopelagicaceae bacterium]
MFNMAAEKTASLLILVGAPFVTVFLVTQTVTDPVNATKLAAAGGLGIALLALTLFFNFKALISENKLFLVLALSFIFAGINAVLNSSSPTSQNIYGSFGRNTGFVTYLVLLAIAIAALTLRETSSFKRIILGLQIAGIINVLYCSWVLVFGDFLSWNNPYGNILGLFGNPNFISSFLGIFIATVLAQIAAPKTSWKLRLLGGLISVVAFYQIVDSNSIQGIVVTAGALAIVGFFVVRSRFQSLPLTSLYVFGVSIVGALAIMGALQKGPWTFIYKTSVSLRGAYWNAGIEMGLNHPLTGVGMDSYGDWYRRARSEYAATVLPGPKVFTNAAHNVVIDFFAYGGFPLLLAYLGMLLLGAISAIKVIRRTKSYDSVFIAMFTAWACYQVQSLISINQVGLALWGWILTGALIAYERTTKTQPVEAQSSEIKKRKISGNQSASVISPQLVAGLGVVLGVLIAVPPLSADMKWRSALDSKDANKVMVALESGYLNPSDSQRYAQAVQLFANSNLMDKAHEVAMNAVQFNPEYFDAWKIVYLLSNSTPEEKALALKNMKRLDPRNPDVTAQ